jgi:hypothetical protein
MLESMDKPQAYVEKFSLSQFSVPNYPRHWFENIQSNFGKHQMKF